MLKKQSTVQPVFSSSRVPALLHCVLAGLLVLGLGASNRVLARINDESASDWHWQNPLPQGNTLRSVFFTDANTGTAVGAYGTILHTSDGGTTWAPEASGTANLLYGVDFTDANTGTAVGAFGTILRTVDGGATWTPQSSGTDHFLLAVSFVDSNTGTAVGVSDIGLLGKILHTTDGGATWSEQTTDAFYALNGVSFVDANTGTAVGAGAKIIHTTDGGATWTDQTSPVSFDPYAVTFVDANIGTIVGNNGTILHTTDGGATWSVQASGTTVSLSAVSFTDENTGTIVAQTGLILRTTDGGNTWIPQASGTQNFLFGGYFVDANTGTAVGDAGTILHTVDGGATWTIQTRGITLPIAGVSFVDARTGTAVGDKGTILRTTDGGAHWTPQSSGTTSSLIGVSFTDVNTGTVVGAQGTILRTTDGGATWVGQSSGTTNTLYGVSFGDANTGTAVGLSGTIVHTNDGGETWSVQSSGTTLPLYSVAFSGDTETIVGWGGRILQTTDGGATWIPRVSGTSNQLKGVSFGDASTGIAVGDFGTIVRTTDGGASWTVQSSGTPNLLNAVSFLDANTGTAVGQIGTILHTTDGGTTWIAQPSGTTNELSAIDLIDADTATATGLGGTILRTGESTPATHIVTPSVGAPSGMIEPSVPQTVNEGDTVAFTLTPNVGFDIDNVGGTCGGTLSGTVYTTDAVTADCTVIANFVANDGTPTADVSPGSLSFTVAAGNSASNALTIANIGGGSLTWTATDSTACGTASDLPWLTEAPESGSVGGGDSAISTITVNAASLSAGSYSGHVCFATNDAAHATVDVPVDVTVTGGGGDNGIILSGPLNHPVTADILGTSLNIATSAFDDTGPVSGDWDFNFYQSGGFAFYTISTYETQYVVDGAGKVAVLHAGDAVSGSSTFSANTSTGNVPSAPEWSTGANGYAGVRFNCDGRLPNPVSGGVCYGFVHITTSPSGFPASIVDTGFDGDGNPITITGAPPGNDPSATVTPVSLSLTAAADATATAMLDIANAAGSDPLTYSIETRGTKQPRLIAHTDNSKTGANPRPDIDKLVRLDELHHRPAPSLVMRGVSHSSPRMPAGPAGSQTFQADDGSYENTIGLNNSQNGGNESFGAVWVNRFAATGALTIDSISIEWPGGTGIVPGMQPNLLVYYDASSSGDLANAVRVGTDTIVTIAGTDAFETYPVNFSVPGAGDVYIGFADAWALVDGGFEGIVAPAAIDMDSSPGAAFLSGQSAAGVLTDLDDLANNNLTGSANSFGFHGNWMVRATASAGDGGACTGPIVGWLSANPSSGSVAGGAHTSVTITANPAAADWTPARTTASSASRPTIRRRR